MTLRLRRATTAVALSALGAAALLAPLASPLVAQQRSEPVFGNGYRFGRPAATLQLRIGVSRPNANSEVFDFASDLLTISPNDYLGFAYGAEIGVPITQRIELQFTASAAARKIGSEYRDFVDNLDQPIEQQTELRRVPMTAGVRYNLVPAGRSVSRLAWIPTPLVPYVAAGGGVMWYRFRQEGDFIDFQTNDVFNSRLNTSGWAGVAYAATGMSWSLNPGIALNAELRYDQARAPLARDFEGFDRIQLSSVGLTTAILFRF